MIVDVAPGLWIWRITHPDWEPSPGGDRRVTSTCVEAGSEIALLDPLAPPEDDAETWARLDARPPTMAVVLKPDHVRSVDAFVGRYGCRALGPDVFFKDDIPETDLEPIYPGSHLPGGLVALFDGRGRNETPLYLPDQRTIVFSDGMTSLGGELQIWSIPWYDHALRAFAAMLDLPFERVIVSHGEPVHDRAEFERALERPPYTGSP